MKVFIYRNLHANKWSIKALEGKHKGLVVAHADYVWLSDVTPKVSESGRQRVLREKKKYVHAGLVGHIVNAKGLTFRHHSKDYAKWDIKWLAGGGIDNRGYERVSYNPYKGQSFYLHNDPLLYFKHSNDAHLYTSGKVDVLLPKAEYQETQLELAI